MMCYAHQATRWHPLWSVTETTPEYFLLKCYTLTALWMRSPPHLHHIRAWWPVEEGPTVLCLTLSPSVGDGRGMPEEQHSDTCSLMTRDWKQLCDSGNTSLIGLTNTDWSFISIFPPKGETPSPKCSTITVQEGNPYPHTSHTYTTTNTHMAYTAIEDHSTYTYLLVILWL